MAKYQVVKTVTYDLVAEVEAETERDVYELLDDNAIEFDNPSTTDEVVEVFWIGDTNAELV